MSYDHICWIIFDLHILLRFSAANVTYLIISVIWYRYIGGLVPIPYMPRRGLLASLAAPLPSVFFMELRLR